MLLLPGDLKLSLESGSPLYAGVFLAFYVTAVVLYLCLLKSDPGYLKAEESRTLLENGEMRRRSKDRLFCGQRLIRFGALHVWT